MQHDNYTCASTGDMLMLHLYRCDRHQAYNLVVSRGRLADDGDATTDVRDYGPFTAWPEISADAMISLLAELNRFHEALERRA